MHIMHVVQPAILVTPTVSTQLQEGAGIKHNECQLCGNWRLVGSKERALGNQGVVPQPGALGFDKFEVADDQFAPPFSTYNLSRVSWALFWIWQGLIRLEGFM